MADPFSAAGPAWQPVSPRLATVRRGLLATACLLAAVLVVVVVLVLDLPLLIALVVLASLSVLGAWGWWLIGRNARSWGYAEHDSELSIVHGVMFRRLVTVPYGRMQYVDVQAGPLDQLAGIAKVHLHTASPGTSAIVPGLPAAEAARLRDRLTALGEAQAAGL